MQPDEFDHPELRDQNWARGAERRARREARKFRRRQIAIWGQPRKRSRHLRTIAVVVAVLAVAGGAIYLIDFTREEQPVGNYADQPASDPIDLDRPFAATPAQDWADGADGIVVPTPGAVGGFSAERVSDAFVAVKEILVASRIDRRMLDDGGIEPFVSLFAQSQHGPVREEFAGDEWPAPLATRIAPGFRLLRVEPKVKGAMVAEAGEETGELRIRTSYVFAYAFDIDDPAQASAPLDIVAMYRADAAFVLREGSRWHRRDQGFFFDGAEAFAYSFACAPMRDGLLAPSYAESPGLGLPGSRRPPEYFDPSLPIPDENTCEPSAG